LTDGGGPFRLKDEAGGPAAVRETKEIHMRTRIVIAGAALLGLLGAAGTATAQQGRTRPAYGPGYRPLLSPYLDLADFGSGVNGRSFDPAIRYYNGTLVEFDRRANTDAFRSAFQEIERNLSAPPTPEDDAILRPLPQTGHQTAFGNTGGFFQDPYRNRGGVTSRPRR
jgi:hypothetical protein